MNDEDDYKVTLFNYLFFKMDKLITEIFTALKEKISSPFLRYFSVSWILWNYKFVYFIFFQDQKIFFDVYKITKFDYLMNNNYFYETFYCNVVIFLIFPILSALFFIYLFPKLNIYFLKEYDKTTQKEDEIKYLYRKFIKEKDIELKKLEVEEKKEEAKVVEEEVKKTKATKEKIDLEINQFDEWNKEYEDFKNKPAYKIFDKIIEIINFDEWDFRDYSSDINFWDKYKISKNIISFLISNNVIIKINNSYHKFTEKWKYFAKLYFEENNK